MVDTSLAHALIETDVACMYPDTAAMLHAALDELDSLRQRVAELERLRAMYEAVMSAAKMDVEAIARVAITDEPGEGK